MANCSHKKNPLVRQGTSQDQRALPAFSTETVELIDKSPVDWMVWGSSLSGYITRYALNNQPAGDMSAFFANDIAARLANIAVHPIESIPQCARRKLDIIYENDNSANELLLKVTYTQLFDLVFSYIYILDQQITRCTEAENFTTLLKNHIKQRLQFILDRALSYYLASKQPAHDLIDNSEPLHFKIFKQDTVSSEIVVQYGLSSTWWSGQPTWELKLSSINPEDAIFGTLAVTVSAKIRHAAAHNFFTQLLDEISSSSALIVKESRTALDKKINSWPYHKPHYALYLAHLELMESARHDMNTLPDRHLNFYYRDVLRFKPKPPVPDSAHLILELNKTTLSYSIKANTGFNGGNNDNGEMIIYESERDTIINKATIAGLKSVYLGDSKDNISSPYVNNRGRLFASAIANSSDGLGADLTTDLGEWHPFYIKNYNNGVIESIGMPEAEVGFAIASHYLKLQEGKRSIVLNLAVDDPLRLNGIQFSAKITSEKEWLELNFTGFSPSTFLDGTTSAARLTFEISGDMDPVTGYVPKTHGYNLDTTDPVLLLLIEHDSAVQFPYTDLANLLISKVELQVVVGSINGSYNEDGLKNLELHNDFGQLNGAKPFMPWGPEPTKGASFIIGSEEVFQKPASKFQLNMKWKDLHNIFEMVYPINLSPETRVDILDKGKWVVLTSSASIMSYYWFLVLDDNAISLPEPTSPSVFLEKNDVYPGYSAASQNGYIRLSLLGDFGYENYLKDNIKYLVRFAKNPDSPGMVEPWEPYQPVMESIFLSYSAHASIDLEATSSDEFEDRHIQFYHVGPFGQQEQHFQLQGSVVPTPTLLPTLIENQYPDITPQGAFYIGLNNILPGESTSILFQLNEGSENPLRSKPDDHLTWSWLGENGIWYEFEKNAIEDGTSHLIESGIIKFAIPTEASTENKIMPDKTIWLRAIATTAPDAVSSVIGIKPNAIKVKRSLTGLPEVKDVFSKSGSITKLVTPIGQIKKIEQPYNSFGGKATEDFKPFYQRVAERLRHKNRAITIWDYERLVLEAFPEIYRVKCLNHTKLTGSEDDGTLDYNEVAPGHVTVITIPDLQNRNDTDPLKPYTKTSLLEKIKAYLDKRSSCHVCIHTAQPLFEEVQVKCKVYLKRGYSDLVYYENRLREELTKYLSPWAFDSSSDVKFGGIIYKSAVIDFIDELIYVDYITDVQLYRLPCSDCDDVDEVKGSTARSILVSAAAEVHGIEVYNAASNEQDLIACDD